MLIVVVPTGGKAGGGNRQKRGKKLGKVGGNLPVAHRQMRVEPDDPTPANLANVEMVFVFVFVFWSPESPGQTWDSVGYLLLSKSCKNVRDTNFKTNKEGSTKI